MIVPTLTDLRRRVIWAEPISGRSERGTLIRLHRTEGAPNFTAAFVRFDNHPGEIKVSLPELTWA
jgi:ribosomal protein L35AE/L33A